MMVLEKKKYRSDERETMATARDLFGELPIELIQTILSFLITHKKQLTIYTSLRFEDTKEAVKTIILSKRFLHAWSTFPDVYLSDFAFHKLPRLICANPNQIQEYLVASEKFANYVLHTVTRYQQHNIPIRRLHLTDSILDNQPVPISMRRLVEDDDGRIANVLEQSIRKANENGVKEVYLHMHMVHIRHSNFLQTIFALNQLISLYLCGGDLVKKDVQYCDMFINCSSLRTLVLENVGINEAMLQKLIHSCPLIEGIHIISCHLIESIQVANLPNLKRLKVTTHKNQTLDVKAASLELLIYNQSTSRYVLNIESASNLKILKLECVDITDLQFHSLIAKCHVLEELTLDYCEMIQNINISSHSLCFLSIICCRNLMEVKIDVPSLNMFVFHGGIEAEIPTLSFADGGSKERKSNVSLYLHNLEEVSLFLELREFLKSFKYSDTISLTIATTEEISFDRNIIDGSRDQNIIPEFAEVCINLEVEYFTSSTHSNLMEGLLWSFSPKIIYFILGLKKDLKLLMHICHELPVQHDDHPNISTSPSSKCWRNYFKKAMFKDRDGEWRPLDNRKSLEDESEYIGFILKLSND